MKQQTDPKQGALKRCYHLSKPDRIQIAFDDHRLVANAGLLLPVTLAQRLVCPNWLTATLTWAALLAEPTPATR